MAERFPATMFETLVGDLTGPLDLPPLDGLVAANSLHFVARERQVDVVRQLATHLRPGGAFLVVEYDADRGNPWVPHPFSGRPGDGWRPRPASSTRDRSGACRAGSWTRSTRR